MPTSQPEVTSVPTLDLQRYLGLWFEIGRLPNRFEEAGASDVTAEYSLNDDGTVTVENSCVDEDGDPSRAVGQAVPDDAPGRPSTRALATAKLAEIDTKIAELHLARAIVEWGLQCTCPSIDACSCGIHPAKPWDSQTAAG